MLLKMSIQKLMVTFCALIIILLIYLIPSNEIESLNVTNSAVEYVFDNTVETVYLLDTNDYVSRSTIATCNCDETSKAKELIEALIIDGKKNEIIPSGFRSIIPPNTRILNISLEEGVLTIDFSTDILDVSKAYEEKMIEALVFSLTSLNGVEKVKILVEGEELEYLPHSHKKIDVVLDKTFGINKEYNISSFNEVSSFTVYYVAEHNDEYYYVPVTKYVNNSSQDKIKLIIENLSSSINYESNLMSFLNSSAELIDYNLDSDIVTLNFNNMILDDITGNNILEEVIYTICLSLEDNIGVKEVNFNVDDKNVTTILLKNLD